MDRVRAPELESNLGWLSTDRPLKLSGELKGQIVVIDFWTYCCGNCLHILPDLAYLEKKYADRPVTFIGVHSAKFSNESSRETIRAAIARHEIKHPVLVDENMKLWRAYAVRSWPTVVVIDPQGYEAYRFAGEGHREEMDNAVSQLLEQGTANGNLADKPLNIKRDGTVKAASGLAFPSKVLADARTNRLYVADTNHNRIVIAEMPNEHGHAKVVKVIGSGETGRENGPANSASFYHPMGMAVALGQLYVCDTDNHLVRSIDLDTYEVTTALGTGEMTYDWAGGGMGADQGINSPWDICFEGSTMYCAMCGTHQIWRVDMPVGFARGFAGTGRENLVDGPSEQSAWAQPSGICAMGGKLYVADSEVSAIRGIDLASEQVFTIIGEGLFYFGDEDGTPPTGKLQHPLGVTAWKGSLIIADTYNHKIKLVSPKAQSVRTLYGDGKPGTALENGKPAFFEPGGVSVIDDILFVADTNNHRIVRIDLVSHKWSEVVLEGMPDGRDTGCALRDKTGQVVDGGSVHLNLAADVAIEIQLTLPEGMHLNIDAPWSIVIRNDDRTLWQKTEWGKSNPLCTTLPGSTLSDPGSYQIYAAVTCCDDAGGVCLPLELSWKVNIEKGDSEQLTL